ncbi:MAG: Rpn family recombination-promoting nuclease/putative transposase [Saprospiraceae bacterium]
MMGGRPLISFDWAIKRLLRQKANYEVLEGFLTVLLRRKITIINIPDAQGDKATSDDKSNAVDILCEDEHKELILIELQYNSETNYFRRMLYGVSKTITEHMFEGFEYDQVRKVYSINIVYFDLGQGDDYVYHGKTEFRGIHTDELLRVNAHQREFLGVNMPYEVFPEYYILKVRKFNDVAKDTLDEWIYYLKNGRLPEQYSAPGLEKAEQILNYSTMDAATKALYDAHIKARRIAHDELETAKLEGREEGLKEGIKEGQRYTVVNAFRQGIPEATIALIATISEAEVRQILQEEGLVE